MKIKIIKASLISVFVTSISTTANAGWPTFNVLSPQTILSELVVHNGCAPGEGRIPTDTAVPIKSRFIPYDKPWYWRYNGNSNCQKLPENLQYIGYHQTGNYTGDTIETSYGVPGNPLFNFIFTIPGPYWFCGYFAGPTPPETIGCAQDTLSFKPFAK